MESQIESARSDRMASAREPPGPGAGEALRKKETLLLARTYLLGQIQASRNPRHREMMERALADLEKALAQFH